VGVFAYEHSEQYLEALFEERILFGWDSMWRQDYYG